jgi:hypothetical protein
MGTYWVSKKILTHLVIITPEKVIGEEGCFNNDLRLFLGENT